MRVRTESRKKLIRSPDGSWMKISHHICFYLILARCQWLKGLYTSCFPLTFIVQFMCVIFHLINSWLRLHKAGAETEAWHNYAIAQTHSCSKRSIKNLNPGSSTSKTQVPNYYASHCCCYSDSQSCPTLRDPVDCSMPYFSVLQYLLEFTQTHVHWVSDAIQPSHPLSPPSPPALSLSQNQSQWAGSSAKIIKEDKPKKRRAERQNLNTSTDWSGEEQAAGN